MAYYHVTIIGNLRANSKVTPIYQEVGYFPNRESAWEFLTGKYGDNTASLQGKAWEVSEVSESAIPDDAWENGEVLAR